MNDTAVRLSAVVSAVVSAASPGLANMTEAEASRPSAPGQWSKKQILGHLIDSAANNHQRFVRAQLERSFESPNYEQESWVAVQSYATESWPDLVSFWLMYNRHLAHIVLAMPEAALAVPCAIGGCDGQQDVLG